MTTKFSSRKNEALSSEKRTISADRDQRQPDAARGLAGRPGARQQRCEPTRLHRALPGRSRACVVDAHRASSPLTETGRFQRELKPAGLREEPIERYFVSDDQGKFTYWSRVS